MVRMQIENGRREQPERLLFKLRTRVLHLLELARFGLGDLKFTHHAHEPLQVYLLGIALKLAACLEHLVAQLCAPHTHVDKSMAAGGGDR